MLFDELSWAEARDRERRLVGLALQLAALRGRRTDRPDVPMLTSRVQPSTCTVTLRESMPRRAA
jgi:hypothetical protein